MREIYQIEKTAEPREYEAVSNHQVNKCKSIGVRRFRRQLLADVAFGFSQNDNRKVELGSSFISAVQMLKADGGMYEEDVTKLYNVITNNGEKEFKTENLAIIGVVVTGTPSELKAYQNLQEIRGATLGATIDKY